MAGVHLNDLPWMIQFLTYGIYVVVMAFSYSQEYVYQFKRWLCKQKSLSQLEKEQGYAPLLNENNLFFEKWCVTRMADLFNRAIASLPGDHIEVMCRDGTSWEGNMRFNGKTQRCINLGSYNYLGFAENDTQITRDDINALRQFGTSNCSPRVQSGTISIHQELEKLMAWYIGKEDCISFGMGYATNSTTIPALVGKGDLIISDTLNHASIVIGCRSSGARIKVFKHNDPEHLEQVLTDAIIEGQPRTHLPWKKIMILVEGIYSMEGEILKLKEIVAIKKKYGCFLYVDEAHSIGAIGKNGRGVTEYCGVDPKDVDILMGTFTKSFASVGGYIAADKYIIDHLRMTAFASVDDFAMSSACIQQIISSLTVISGKDGTDEGRRRLQRLADNAQLFRNRLTERGFVLIGSQDSPVIPMMVIVPAKMPAFSRLCLERNVAVVMASYPATDLLLSRARFCVSAGHSKEDLEKAIDVITEIGNLCLLNYNKNGNYIRLS